LHGLRSDMCDADTCSPVYFHDLVLGMERVSALITTYGPLIIADDWD